MGSDSTTRFTSRVENYVKYRPTYPGAVRELLERECGLCDQSVVADIGSGTGLSAQLLLEAGATVIGVEPNDEMRHAAEALLAHQTRFRSVAATAEATFLPDSSVDFIVAGQAFHWFDQKRSRAEFLRILRSDGWTVLMWNDRSTDATQFLDGYEALLHEFSPEFAEVNHRNVGNEGLAAFFGGGQMRIARFANGQVFDYEGQAGRLQSSSYAPEPGHPNYEPMMAALRQLFDETSIDSKVNFSYETQVFYGHLAP